jgi:hypothetical protein
MFIPGIDVIGIAIRGIDAMCIADPDEEKSANVPAT